MIIKFDRLLLIFNFINLCLISWCSFCLAKTCYLGSINTLKPENRESHNTFTKRQCPANEYQCLRVEANYTVLGLQGNVVFGECTPKNECDGKICSRTRSGMPDLTSLGITYDFSACKEACCDADECNQNNVAEIMKQNSQGGGSKRVNWNFVLLFVGTWCTAFYVIPLA